MAITLDQYREQHPAFSNVDDDALEHHLHDTYYSEMPFEEYAKKVGYTPPPPVEAPKPENTDGDIYRGFKDSFTQTKQLGAGLLAGAGAGLESVVGEGGYASGIKKAGVNAYNEVGKELQETAKPSDSLSYSLDQAKAGNLGSFVDWMQHAAGNAVGQGVQGLATFGGGTLVGKAAFSALGKEAVEGLVAKEMAKIVAKQDAAKIVAQQSGLAVGEQLSGEALTAAATSNIATKFADIGGKAFVAGQAYGMETGEVGGELAAKSVKEDRALTGEEAAKGLGWALAAGTVEFGGEMLGLNALMGKSKFVNGVTGFADKTPGLLGRAQRGLVGGAVVAPVEAGQEGIQTVFENYGEGKDPFNEEGKRDIFDSMGQGFVGGATMGGIGGIAKAQNVDDAINAAGQSVNRSWSTPEFNIHHDLSAIVGNSTVPAQDLQSSIDNRYNDSGYVPLGTQSVNDASENSLSNPSLVTNTGFGMLSNKEDYKAENESIDREYQVENGTLEELNKLQAEKDKIAELNALKGNTEQETINSSLEEQRKKLSEQNRLNLFASILHDDSIVNKQEKFEAELKRQYPNSDPKLTPSELDYFKKHIDLLSSDEASQQIAEGKIEQSTPDEGNWENYVKEKQDRIAGSELIPVPNELPANEQSITGQEHNDIEGELQQQLVVNQPENINEEPISELATGTIEASGEGQGSDTGVVNLPIKDITRPNGAIGHQGVTETQVKDILNNVSGMNFTDSSTMREMVDGLKEDKSAQQKLRDFTEKNPIKVDVLPDDTLHVQDGHHRAFLLNQLGDENIPAIVSGNHSYPDLVKPETTPPTPLPESAPLAVTNSLTDFTDKALNDSGYKDSYLSDKDLLQGFKDGQRTKWKEHLEALAEKERLPDEVVDEYVKEFGQKELMARMRGVKETGIKGWIPKDIRDEAAPKEKKKTVLEKEVHERTWPQQLAQEKAGLSRKLTRKEIEEARNSWLSTVAKAQREGKVIPEKVLQSRDIVLKKNPVKKSEDATRLTKITDTRIKGNEEYLKNMAKSSGWSQVGGKMLRDSNGKITRTTWIPNESWYQELYPADRLPYEQTVIAVNKAINDEPMTAKEKRAVSAILDILDDQENEANNSGGSLEDYYESEREKQELIDRAREVLVDVPYDDKIGITDIVFSNEGLTDEEQQALEDSIFGSDKRTTEIITERQDESNEGELSDYTNEQNNARIKEDKRREKQQQAAELKAKNKEKADKEVDDVANDFMGTSPATNDVFGGNPLDDLGKSDKPVKSESPAYGSENKYVTQARREEILAKLKGKFGTLNSGFDPETAILGMELAMYHIEAGVRKFPDVVAKLSEDIGVPIAALKPHLRAWYNGARDYLDDRGENVDDMDDTETVKAELKKLFETTKDSTTKNTNEQTTKTEPVLPNTGTDTTGNDATTGNDVGEQEKADEVVRILEAQIPKQKTIVRNLNNTVEKNKHSHKQLDEKLADQKKYDDAQKILRALRANIFKAEDAAIQVIKTGDLSHFEEYKELFKDANKYLEGLVSSKDIAKQEKIDESQSNSVGNEQNTENNGIISKNLNESTDEPEIFEEDIAAFMESTKAEGSEDTLSAQLAAIRTKIEAHEAYKTCVSS